MAGVCEHVITFRVSKNTSNFLTSSGTTSWSRTPLTHGISYYTADNLKPDMDRRVSDIRIYQSVACSHQL